MARHLIGNALRHQRNRFYVPTTGQFTQQDPIGLAGGVNLYAFAGGDPLNFRDPFGLCPWCKGEAFREIGRRLAPAQGPLEAMGVLATLPLGGATSKVGSEALAIGASFRAASAGRALAASAASKGRALIAQEGRHSLTLNRHAATGSQTSKLAHDFISAGLEFDDAVTAVARDIGPLARLAPGVQKGTVELGGRAIGCSRNTLQTGETSEPLDSRTMKLQDVADELELAEAQGASAKVLDLLMQRISTEAELWQLADLLIAYPSLLGAIYRRAGSLGASHHRAIGYLALSHAMGGDETSAENLFGDLPQRSDDDIVLSAWVLTANLATEVVSRLLIAVHRAPLSLRLWRHLADQAMRAGLLREAEQAYLRLAELETAPEQQRRVARVLREQGWPSATG